MNTMSPDMHYIKYSTKDCLQTGFEKRSKKKLAFFLKPSSCFKIISWSKRKKDVY